MRIIGITGGIGSGKSTVSEVLKSYGAVLVDADKIAREIVRKGERALQEIKAFFGDEIVDSEGELDRKKLGSIVFGNPEKLSVLNSITHKYIIEKIKMLVDEAEKNNEKTVVVDAAIPFETGFMDIAQEIWVIAADESIRIDRVMKRNGLTFEEAQKRIKSQMKQEDYIKLSKHVIYNNGSTNELIEKVRDLFFC